MNGEEVRGQVEVRGEKVRVEKVQQGRFSLSNEHRTRTIFLHSWLNFAKYSPYYPQIFFLQKRCSQSFTTTTRPGIRFPHSSSLSFPHSIKSGRNPTGNFKSKSEQKTFSFLHTLFNREIRRTKPIYCQADIRRILQPVRLQHPFGGHISG